jgi:hypothetical protein
MAGRKNNGVALTAILVGVVVIGIYAATIMLNA